MAATVTPLKASASVFLGDETKKLQMTPAQAAALLARIYDNQRPIIDRHVKAFSDIVDLGIWRETSLITIIRGLPSKTLIVVNGAHRLTMISRRPSPVGVCIRYIDVPDAVLLEQAEAEYRAHDVNGKNRTSKDVLWSYENVRALGLEPHVADKVASAANYIELGFPGSASGVDIKNRNADVRVGPMLKHIESAKMYLDLISGAKKSGPLYKELIKKPIMATGMVICGHSLSSKESLKTFFYTVSRDDGIPAGDPRKLLIELMRNKWKTPSGRSYNDREKAILVRKAWNAFVYGETPEYFRVDAETVLKGEAFIRA